MPEQPQEARSAAKDRDLLVTHKVVIDANDESHAADLYERLHNDGFHVHREEWRLVRDAEGNMTEEVRRVL